MPRNGRRMQVGDRYDVRRSPYAKACGDFYCAAQSARVRLGCGDAAWRGAYPVLRAVHADGRICVRACVRACVRRAALQRCASRKSRVMNAALVPVELPASWLPRALRAPRAPRSNGISARRCCRCICSAKRSTAGETAQRHRPPNDGRRIAASPRRRAKRCGVRRSTCSMCRRCRGACAHVRVGSDDRRARRCGDVVPWCHPARRALQFSDWPRYARASSSRHASVTISRSC